MGMFTNAYNSAKGMVTSQRTVQNNSGSSMSKKTVSDKREKPVIVEYINSKEYEEKIAEFDNMLTAYKENLLEYENKLKQYDLEVSTGKSETLSHFPLDDSFILENQEKLSKLEKELMLSIDELKNNQGKRMLEQMQLLIARIDEQREREEELRMAEEMKEDMMLEEPQGPSEFDELKEKAEQLLIKHEDILKKIVFAESNIVSLYNKVSAENRSTLVTQIAEISNSMKKGNQGLKRLLTISIIFNFLSLGGIVYLVLYIL